MQMLLKPSSFALQGVEVSHMLSKVAGLLKVKRINSSEIWRQYSKALKFTKKTN